MPQIIWCCNVLVSGQMVEVCLEGSEESASWDELFEVNFLETAKQTK